MDLVDVDATLSQVREALAEEDWDRAVALVEALRPPDQADLFGELPRTSTRKTPPTYWRSWRRKRQRRLPHA